MSGLKLLDCKIRRISQRNTQGHEILKQPHRPAVARGFPGEDARKPLAATALHPGSKWYILIFLARAIKVEQLAVVPAVDHPVAKVSIPAGARPGIFFIALGVPLFKASKASNALLSPR